MQGDTITAIFHLVNQEIRLDERCAYQQDRSKDLRKLSARSEQLRHDLPEKIKSQAILALKDEYTFDLVGLSEEHSEYELEQAIIKNIRAFLMEFGPDFAFVGNQYRIEVDGKEYFIDLLLYNRRLQAMIAIELKIGEFLPEYKGKMEFYLNVLNDTVRLPHENPAIGIII